MSFAITPNLEILQTLKEKIKLTGITYSIKEIASVITDREERLNIKIIVNEPDKTLWKCKSSGKIYSSKKMLYIRLFTQKRYQSLNRKLWNNKNQSGISVMF